MIFFESYVPTLKVSEMKTLDGTEPRKLAATTVRNTKPTDKKQTLSDGYGLSLEIWKNGYKYWRYNYRFAGKQNTLTLGVFPEVSLTSARQAHREAYNQVALGLDPSVLRAEVKAEQLKQSVYTFELVAKEWLTAKIIGKKSTSHEKRCQGLLDNHILPFIGNRAITQLTKLEVVQPLKRMQNAGTISSAHKARQVIAQVFDYASASGYIDTMQKLTILDGIAGVIDPIDKNLNYAAVTTPEALSNVLRAIDNSTAGIIVKTAMLLMPMLFQRPKEIAGMRWEELDLEGALWEIPAERMKLKRPHIIPLPTQALALLNTLKPISGHCDFVFPNLRTNKRHMTPESILTGLRNAGIDKETTTAHGFRATARTMLAEQKGLEFSPEIIEHQLAHEVKDPLGRAYNRTKFIEQRTEMMQEWANYLDQLRQGAEVLPFKTKEG